VDVSAVMPLLMFVAVPVFIGLAIWWQIKQTKANQAWAASVGWQYLGTDPTLTERWRGTPFGVGHGRRVSQLMVGPFQGRAAMSFAYRYSTGSGKNESTYTFHVVAMALPAYLPNLQLTPENLGDRIAKTFGLQDIEFESDDFNRAWRVQAGVVKFAHDVLHPRTMERLLRPDAARLSLRIEGTDMLCWTAGGASCDVIAARLQVLKAVIDAIPRYVWLDHGYDPGYGPDSSSGAPPAGRPGVPAMPQLPTPPPTTPPAAPMPPTTPPAAPMPPTTPLPPADLGSPYRPPTDLT